MKHTMITAAILCLIFSTSCTTVRRHPVGVKLYHFQDETRKNWINNTEARPLNTMIWYPAKEGTIEKKHSIAIFNTGTYAIDAPIRENIKKYPLLVLSHGTGGSAASMAWFAEMVAQNGYIVAAVNHHGNTGAEPKYLLKGFVLCWERAKDISKVIDSIIADKYLGELIDKERIGVAGFSLGGYTALAVVGATLHIEKWQDSRNLEGNKAISSLPPEANYTLEDVDNLMNNDAIAIESIRHADDHYADKRIKAAFVMAPVLVPIMDTKSLQAISVPVEIIAGDKDNQSILEENGIPLSRYIKDSRLIRINGVYHYTFLCEGNIHGKLFARQYTEDAKNIDRKKIHQDVARMAIDFFNTRL